jgi:hypothetical protein
MFQNRTTFPEFITSIKLPSAFTNCLRERERKRERERGREGEREGEVLTQYKKVQSILFIVAKD